MATERSHRRHSPSSGPVALFVDWDNFAIGLRQEMPERPPDLGPILRWARRTGTLIVSRAYGEWRDATERLAIYNAGVDAYERERLALERAADDLQQRIDAYNRTYAR